MTNETRRKESFLPNFGSAANGFRVLLVAQAIAIVLTAARNAELDAATWNDFLLMTSFAQLVAIASIVAMKVISPWVQRMHVAAGGVTVLLVLMAVSVLVAEAVIWALQTTGSIGPGWPDWHWSLIARTLIISAIIGALALRYIIVNHRAKLETTQQQQDRLQALQARIRPHFLFNSMNSIATLIRSDPELAEKALQDLADVFRVLLADARKMVPITAEGELARQYLDIEKLRLGERLQVKWTASNVPRTALIPSLTLQPLIENAVYHGIEPSFAGGTVDIQLWSEHDTLNIMISNPVPEISNQAQRRQGNRIAMSNVRERLDRHFGGKASLQNFEKLGMYHVKLRMPIVRG